MHRRRGIVASLVAVIIFSVAIIALTVSWDDLAANTVSLSIQNSGVDSQSSIRSAVAFSREQTESQIGWIEGKADEKEAALGMILCQRFQGPREPLVEGSRRSRRGLKSIMTPSGCSGRPDL